MIVTVTMNPAIDKTAELQKFTHEGLNRLENVVSDVGGKGINVSKTIRALGGKTIATGFLAGGAGQGIKSTLDELGIENDFIFVEGETRTNLKVLEPGGVLTELNEQGPVVSQESIEALVEKLEFYATEKTVFVLAGSIPKGVNPSIYKVIIERLKAKNAQVFLDVDGEPFEEAIEAGPDMIKPNKFELLQYYGIHEDKPLIEVIEIAQRLREKNVKNIAISMGKEGALFLIDQKVYQVPGLEIEAHSAVGAGDAMVAAITYGMHEGLEVKDWIALAVATSAGAVVTIGTKPPNYDLVRELKEKVKINEII